MTEIIREKEFSNDVNPQLEDVIYFIKKARMATSIDACRKALAQADTAATCLLIANNARDERTTTTKDAGYITKQVSDSDMPNVWREVDHKYDSVTKNNPNEDKAMSECCKKIKKIMVMDEDDK